MESPQAHPDNTETSDRGGPVRLGDLMLGVVDQLDKTVGARTAPEATDGELVRLLESDDLADRDDARRLLGQRYPGMFDE